MKFNPKSICLIFATIFISTISLAQVGIGTTSPDASAKLEISSTSQGLLPPRMTYAQRQAISSPAIGLMIYCTDCGNGEPQYYSGVEWKNMIGGTGLGLVPLISTTTAATNITYSSATSGGNITNDNGSAIIARGVCWSTSPDPTKANSKTTESGTTGSFTSVMTGLTHNTLYYVRAYATNAAGTSYAAQVSFTTSNLQIGDAALGGVVAYILQSYDLGYNANVLHGLIAASSDQSTGAEWGCMGSTISGANGTAIGTGNQNTIDIMNGCATAGIAARLCGDLVEGGYSDWYLPSQMELFRLFWNRAAIGGFSTGFYWSSSQIDSDESKVQDFSGNTFSSGTPEFKNQNRSVRAIRAF